MDFTFINEFDFNESGEQPIAVKIAVIFLLCMVIWVVGYFYIIKDKEMTLTAAEAEEAILKQSYRKKYAKSANLEVYKEQMKEMKIIFSAMLKQLPNQSEVADLLIDVSRSGLVNGLEFELFKPSPEQTGTFYATLPIQMKVTGYFHQFGEFVSAVATLPRIVTMHDLTLSPLGGEPPGKMMMDITAKTYRYFDEE